ncbi:isochorismatase, partial [Phyllosticta citrichinensis]
MGEHTTMPEAKKQIAAASPYAWPHDASLSRETTALVIVDMQNDFCTAGGYIEALGYSADPARAIIPNIKRLLDAFRKAGWQVYHTREGHRPDLSTLWSRTAFRAGNNPGGATIGQPSPLGGRLLVRGGKSHDIVDELYPIAGEPVVDKPGQGAFAHTDFELLLRNRGIKNLVLTGVTTDICVSTTMREASDRGFDCAMVRDGTASAKAEHHDPHINSMTEEGGIFGVNLCVADVLEALG